MAGSPSAIGHDVRCIRNSGSLKRALARPVLSRQPAGVLPTLRLGRSWPPWRMAGALVEFELKVHIVHGGEQCARGGRRRYPSVGGLQSAGERTACSFMMGGGWRRKDHVLDGLVELAIGRATFIIAADHGEYRPGGATGFARGQ